MSLKPIKRSRRRNNRYPRLETGGSWNFSWKPIQRFEPSKHKRGLLLLALLCLGTFAVVWANDPDNPLFHSYSSGTNSTVCQQQKDPGAGCNDPNTHIWEATGTNGESEFNTINVGNQAGCAAASTNCFQMQPNSTNTAIALSKNNVGDLGIAAGKSLNLFTNWLAVGNTPFNLNDVWGIYLTTNSTLPLTAHYNPEGDPNVVYDEKVVCENNPTCTNAGPVAYALIVSALRTLGKGDTITSESTGGCPGSISGTTGSGSSCYLSTTQNLNPFGNLPLASSQGMVVYLNYTGNTQPTNCAVVMSTLSGSGCSWLLEGAFSSGSFSMSGTSSTNLPFFAFTAQQYYIGFYALAGNNRFVSFTFNTDTSAIVPGNNIIEAFVPGSSTSQAQPNIDTGGWFGPIIKALINIGSWILNGILQFIGFITPALQSALNFLESILVTALNGLGNALGLGNVGTTLQTFINAVITFFTNGQFGNIISNFPSAISRLIDILTVYFPWLAQAITAGANVATFLVKGAGFTLTALTFATNIGSGVTVTILIVLFFVYTGDNSLGGVLEFWQTTIWIVVGLGLKLLVHLVNFILDVVTNIIGIIPKPFIQMVAHATPRLPIVNTEASFVPPSGLMGEIRNGNLFALALWISGLLFVDLYESASPALPGSIGALLPSAAGKLTALTGLTPLLEIMVFLAWTAALFIVPIGWFANAMDLGQLPVESSLGNRPQTHFGIRVSRAEKHNNLRGSVRGFREAFRRKGPQFNPRARQLGIMQEKEAPIN